MSERLNELVEYLMEKAALIQNYHTIIEEYEGQFLNSALAVKLICSGDSIAAEEKKLEALLQPPACTCRDASSNLGLGTRPQRYLEIQQA